MSRWNVVITIALALAAGSAHARIIPLPLGERVAAADAVAVVRVCSTRQNNREGRFQRVACAQVIRLIKGEQRPAFEIEFISDFKCETVVYAPGDEAIVFLRRREGGRWETLQGTYGHFPIQGGACEWESSDDEYWQPAIVPTREAMARLSELVQVQR